MKRDGCETLQVNDFYMMHGVVCRFFGSRMRVLTWVRIDYRRYGSFLSRFWLQGDYRYSHQIIAISHFIHTLLPSAKHKKLIYDPFSPTQKSRPKTATTQKIVYIGNYIEGKGQQYAIQAFAIIARDFPQAQLHFYGGDMGLEKNRRYREGLEELSYASELKRQVHFHGFVEDVSLVLAGACMALNFSDSESFSMTVLEAQSYGVAVVATASGGPQEIIVDGVTGLLVRVGDVNAMAEAMGSLLGNPQRTWEMGERAVVQTGEKFSPQRFKENIIELFEGGES